MSIIRSTILLVGGLFFERRYMAHLQGKYIIRGIIGKLFTFLPWDLPWPMHPASRIYVWQNIEFDPADVGIFQAPGCHFGAAGKIRIGRGSRIASGVGLITANHVHGHLSQMTPAQDIVLGDNCWLAMNSVIMPGITLGDNVTVGAGSVVTKSFPDNVIIAGNPARIIKHSVG